MSLQLLAKQADLPTFKTSLITLIAIFQKTVRFSSNVKILVPIDGSDVYAQTLGQPSLGLKSKASIKQSEHSLYDR